MDTLAYMMSASVSVRPPAVAGSFYPRQPERLRAQIVQLLEWAAIGAAKKERSAARPPKGYIIPHAGYPYSGPVAASAYTQLQAAAASGAGIERVVLIGPAHRVYVPSVATAGVDRFQTPLGAIEIDAAWLRRAPEVEVSLRAHAPEHCLEVQLPFLQCILPQSSWRLVPLLVSDATPAVVGGALERLWGGPETCIIISSDLSHYQPYQEACSSDQETARRVVALDDTLVGEDACGCAAINGLTWLARKKKLRVELLDLRNSGDTAGSREEVVGYGSFAIHEENA